MSDPGWIQTFGLLEDVQDVGTGDSSGLAEGQGGPAAHAVPLRRAAWGGREGGRGQLVTPGGDVRLTPQPRRNRDHPGSGPGTILPRRWDPLLAPDPAFPGAASDRAPVGTPWVWDGLGIDRGS